MGYKLEHILKGRPFGVVLSALLIVPAHGESRGTDTYLGSLLVYRDLEAIAMHIFADLVVLSTFKLE